MIARTDEDLALDALSPSLLRQPRSARAVSSDPDLAVAACAHRLDHGRLRADFERQGAFIYLDEFLPSDVTAELAANARAFRAKPIAITCPATSRAAA